MVSRAPRGNHTLEDAIKASAMVQRAAQQQPQPIGHSQLPAAPPAAAEPPPAEQPGSQKGSVAAAVGPSLFHTWLLYIYLSSEMCFGFQR